MRSDVGPRAEDLLCQAFRERRWRVTAGRGCDFVARKESAAYGVVVKALSRRPERSLLEPLLAAAILEARAAEDASLAPLAVVAAHHLSTRLIRRLEDYAARFAPRTSWGAVGVDGRIILRGPGLEDLNREPPSSRAGRRRLGAPAGARQDPFTDLGQWMIKVLLAHDVPERWLRSPREPLCRVQDLARAAAVSMASASKLLSALEARGHLEVREGRLEVVRKRALLESWRHAASPGVDVPCAFLTGVDLASSVAENAEYANGADDPVPSGAVGRRACLGLFAACRALGLGFVRGAPDHMYVERLDPGLLERLGLHAVDHPAQADIFVRVPRFPQSVFRGCVPTPEGPAADAVQCFLDVSSHPARGAEQAQEILRVLGVE